MMYVTGLGVSGFCDLHCRYACLNIKRSCSERSDLLFCLNAFCPLKSIFLTLNLLVLLPVMTESTTSRCLAACFIAHSTKFLADQISGSRSLKHLGSVMYLPFLFRNLWSYKSSQGIRDNFLFNLWSYCSLR